MATSIVRAPESAKFAFRELEDMQSVEAAALSGAIILSGVSSELQQIQNFLQQNHQVLMNAEANWEKMRSTDPDVQKCTMELEDVARCTETAICMFIKKVGSVNHALLPDIFKLIEPKPVDFFALHKLKADIKMIHSRVGRINIKDLGEPSENAITLPARRSICNVDEIWLLGLQIYWMCILQRLLDERLQTRSVIQVVGTNSFANTVLAERIYQSTEVKTHFEASFWLFPQIRLDTEYDNIGYKSHTYLYQPIDILRKMLLKLGFTKFSHDEDYLIMSRLRDFLKEKRCLVVIDNNWTELWTLLNAAFPDGDNGSRVLITSKRQGLSDYKYELPFLNYQDSLNFLKESGKMNSVEVEEYPSDLFLGNQFLFNPSFCQNDRPNKGDQNQWYDALPSVLKMCIAYMAAVFPCGSIIHADSLIRLWIVEGIIPQEQGRTRKDIAENYLDQLVQRGLLRIIGAYYHNQANHLIRSIVLHPSLHRNFNFAVPRKKNSMKHSMPDIPEIEFSPVTVILTLDDLDIYNEYPEKTANWHRLALHLPYQFNHTSSFVKEPKLQCFNCPSLHSLFFFGSVCPVESSQFTFLRVLAVFSSHIVFPEEYTPCWLDALINLRYLGFILCLVEGESLGTTLNSLGRLKILDLSESIVSGLSEFMKNNKEVKVVGPAKEELRECWFPIPDMSQ